MIHRLPACACYLLASGAVELSCSTCEVLCGSARPRRSRRALPGGAVWQCGATAEPSCSTRRCCVAVQGHSRAVVLYPEVLWCGSARPRRSRRALPVRCCGVAVRGHGGAVVFHP